MEVQLIKSSITLRDNLVIKNFHEFLEQDSFEIHDEDEKKDSFEEKSNSLSTDSKQQKKKKKKKKNKKKSQQNELCQLQDYSQETKLQKLEETNSSLNSEQQSVISNEDNNHLKNNIDKDIRDFERRLMSVCQSKPDPKLKLNISQDWINKLRLQLSKCQVILFTGQLIN